MIYKPTEKFASLGQSSSYQGLDTDVYISLKRGEEVEIENPREHLIEGGYIEAVGVKPSAKTPAKEKKPNGD